MPAMTLRFPESAPTTPNPPTPDVLAVDAGKLASLLSIGLRTLRSWDAAGKLPAPIRIGKTVRWRLSEIEEWLRAGSPCRERWNRIKSS